MLEGGAVALLLPTGSSARKAPSLRHVCDEVDEKTETEMEFKFNDEIYSRLNSTPFFKPDCEKTRMPCIILCEDLTLRFCLFFLHYFSSVTILFGNFDLVKPYILGGKKRKTTRRSGIEIDTQNMYVCVQNFTVFLSKPSWAFRPLRGKHVYFAHSSYLKFLGCSVGSSFRCKYT